MKRRAFFKAIATIAAASATTDISGLLASPATSGPRIPPVIDWTQWNDIRLTNLSGKVLGFVNNQDVSMFPDIMRRLCGYIHFDGESIRLSPMGLADQFTGTGFRFVVPEIDTEAPLTFGCAVKFDGNPTLSQPFFMDDLYVTDDKEIPAGAFLQPPSEEEMRNNWDGRLNRGEGKGLRIEAVTPRSSGSYRMEE